jgi:hypothetical protein
LHHVGSSYILNYDAWKIKHKIAHRRNRLSFTNLRLPEFGEIRADVEADSFGCSRERDATYQQNGQQDIREQGCEVHYLQ